MLAPQMTELWQPPPISAAYPFATDAEPWPQFLASIRLPYLNSAFLPGVDQWGDNLHQRHLQGENIRLAFVEVQHEITGKKFNAFCLNGKAFISAHPAVLTLPHPRNPNDDANAIPPDQFVGIWLHYYGPADDIIRICEQKIAAKDLQPQGDFVRHPYTTNLIRTLSDVLADPELPGKQANKIYDRQLRIARTAPIGNEWHQDADKTPDRKRANKWGRTLIHPILRTGPLFSLDRECHQSTGPTTTLPSLIGGTSSHFMCQYAPDNILEWGIEHFALGHPDGRALYLIEGINGRRPIHNTPPTPWKIVPVALPRI